MTLINESLWEFWMGDMPMPEGCTYEQMAAARDAIQKIEDREYALEQIKFWEEQWRKWIPKYRMLKKIFDNNPSDLEVLDYEKDWERAKDILKMCKEQITYWQKELVE